MYQFSTRKIILRTYFPIIFILAENLPRSDNNYAIMTISFILKIQIEEYHGLINKNMTKYQCIEDSSA